MIPVRSTAPAACVPLVLATFALGIAITFNYGAYEDRALAFVLLALMALAWAAGSSLPFARFGPPGGPPQPDAVSARSIAPLVWIVVAMCLFWSLGDRGLIMYAHRPWTTVISAMHWTALVLLTYLPGLVAPLREPRPLKLARFCVLAYLVTRAGVDVIRTSPQPAIDVWTVQQQGAQWLLHGMNPYTHVAAADTTPGRFGGPTPYVYPPTQILVGLPAFWLLGDVRFAMLFAMVASGVALRVVTWRARDRDLPALVEDGPSLLVWGTPKVFFILEQAWVDPVPLFFVAVAFALASYGRRLPAAISFGLAASSKQTLFWIVPLAGFCLRFSLEEWLVMVASAAAPVIPFAVWNFAALKRSNFDFLVNIPSRPDGLTVENWLNREYLLGLQGTYAFKLTAVVVALSCWKHRTLGGLACALALTYGVFFAFNKQAFANYWYFVGCLAALGVACLAATPAGPAGAPARDAARAARAASVPPA